MSEWRDISTAPKDTMRVVLPTEDGPVSLVYTTAKRGRICQIRRANLHHIHYFIDEDGTMISDDARRHGVTREQMLEHAPALLKARTQDNNT